MNLGTTPEAIADAEVALEVEFPDGLKRMWLTSNGLELRGDWFVYPVFDKANPRKTAGHIVYENTVGRWDYMDANLVSIATNGTGNQLVLRKVDGVLEDAVYYWDHERDVVRPWGKSTNHLADKAQARVAQIEKLRARGRRA